MAKRVKLHVRVRASADLKLSGSQTQSVHVQGGDYAWLQRKPVVVPKGTMGTIVGMADTMHKYTGQNSRACLWVQWDGSLNVTTVMRYDLELV